MSQSLVLFDVDGYTAIISTSKLSSKEAKSAVRCQASINGKKYLVEVLEDAGNISTPFCTN